MRNEFTDRMPAMIQMILLDRWNPHRLDKKIASRFGLSLDQVRDIRRQPTFLEELERQRDISEQPFVNLSDRKERVVALQQLVERVPDVRVALRLKILAQIRNEVLDAKLPHVHEAPAMANTPPPDQTYGQWLEEQSHPAKQR